MIAGAGPAGLSAALILGRARRSVLICDEGVPRNWASKELHAFLTREGTHPSEFRRLARLELEAYPSVEMRDAEITRAVASSGGLAVTVDGAEVRCRKLLIATGVRDKLPQIPDIESYFGKSVFQCPYCDGWEWRDRPIAVYGRRSRGFEMARAMTAWTADIVLCTDGPAGLTAAQTADLRRNRIAVETDKVARLAGRDGRLEAIVFASGRELARSAVFFDLPARGQSDLGASLGCEVDRSGRIRCGKYEATNVPGVFVAGNVIDDVQLSIVAAAEGARAAFGINKALTREDFAHR